MAKPKFYLTTPIYYANSRPHVGSAYTTLVCDTIARYKRMCGYDVAYLTGSDEHGENIQRAADKLGITPQELVERNCQIFRDLWKLLDIRYTHFIRTTALEHAGAVQKMLRRAQAAGHVYKGRYQGRYCIYDNLYVSDSVEPADCPTCGRPAELMSEENYFFRLSAFQQRLLDLYRERPEFVQPDFRRNEVISFVESGLKDISISRKAIKWGIPWPGDEEHVFYVWYDALTSYLTGIGFAENEQGSEEFRKYWPADLHMMGKEIIRFHGVYWPAFLMAANLPLPKTIFAHGWLLFEQQKMSKSKGNVAYCEPIVHVLGSEALRYYLLRDVVFGQDGNFSHAGLLTRYNSDLANGLGNLVNRTLTMIERYFDAKVPAPGPRTTGPEADPGNETRELFASQALSQIRDLYDRLAFSQVLERIWGQVAAVDKYLTAEKPWALAEDASKRERLATVLYDAAEAVRIIAILAHPVLPQAAKEIWQQLGQPGRLEDQRIDQVDWGQLRPGTRIGKPEAIFPRVDKEEAIERMEAMEQEIRQPSAPPAAAAAAQQAPSKITIDDFAKIEMRVGQVKSAERVTGADKLLKLMVDIGSEVRQLVAGVAEVYKPEDLIGRKVIVVTNLQPRKLRGVESNGMIVAASAPPDGKPVLAGFLEDVPVGARLK